MNLSLCILAPSPHHEQAARDLANSLQLPFAHRCNTTFALELTEHHLQLVECDTRLAIHVDFIEGALAHRQKYGGGKQQPLPKAAGMKQGQPAPSVLDLTAGLAKDAFILASLGCSVTMVERSPIVAALVQDAIQRASHEPTFKPILQRGFRLVNANALDYLKTIAETERPDTIYLDPMYPERHKSALVKKNMQLLQKLLGPDEDSADVLTAALHVAKKRVVIKRPKGAEEISQYKPAFCVESKNTRYDVYLPAT
jgi:16S rRNA (guanine1516-N2)-methyltransferase